MTTSSFSQSKSSPVRLSVCIDMIMTDLPFLARMDRVKRLGYPAFEFWDWKNKEVDAIIRKKNELGLEIATIMGSGWKPLFTEDSRKTFVSEIQASLAAAKRLGSKTLIVTTGFEDKRIPRAEQHAHYVTALKAAAPFAEQAQLTLVLEPLNTKVDHPGYYLQTAKEGFEILDEVGSPAVKMLFDIYHHQIMEGNVIQDITKNISKIAHFHVADVPGRHEPGTGEINYANVFRAIAATGYQGFVGLEFKPSANAEEALKAVLDLV
ncbi:MAG TPA: TIM barrel protein [Blastocatellia bacterium]|nr:TIM barrel protein [Blastocatellia bacterium]